MNERNLRRRVDGVAEGLLGALEQAVGELGAAVATCREKTKTESGETITEYQTLLPDKVGAVDRGGLRQLTGVLKDLKEVLGVESPRDRREREARIAKLERELQDGDAPEITVQWQEELYENGV